MGLLLAALLAVPPLRIEREPWARLASADAPLDLAFLDAERLFVATEDAVTLYQVRAATLESVSRLALPGRPLRVRAAAALLRVVPGEAACWALSNRRAGATLFRLDGGRLVAVAGAEAIPPTAFAGETVAPSGVRFASGTNLLEMGGERWLRLAADGSGLTSEGGLILAGQKDVSLRAGDALAVLGDGFVAVSGDRPAGANDELRLLRQGAASDERVWPVAGRVRALAGQPVPDGALLAMILESPSTGSLVQIERLRWRR